MRIGGFTYDEIERKERFEKLLREGKKELSKGHEREYIEDYVNKAMPVLKEFQKNVAEHNYGLARNNMGKVVSQMMDLVVELGIELKEQKHEV